MYCKNKIKYKLSNTNLNDNLKQDIFFYIKTDTLNNIFKNSNIDNANINNSKNKIDNYSFTKWDKAKKNNNQYEKIYITYKKKRCIYEQNYEPLSRSYFKMIEMSNEYLSDLINKNDSIKTVHLAEGPGGFIEGLIDIRKNNINSQSFQYKDKYYGMTLAPINNKIPGWTRTSNFLNNNKNVNIIKGYDNTGDLYNIKNHKFLISRVGKGTIDLVSGDGGFDFSIDYNHQEVLAHKLIFSQIILALSIQKKGGSFICKLFDTNTKLSKEMIYLLNYYYEDINYYKPFTSRPANSEKYIICLKFKGITDQKIFELQNILNIWNNLPKSKSIISIIEDYNLNDDIINIIEKSNKQLNDIQIKYINETINLIKKPMNRNDLLDNNNNQLKNSNIWINYYCKDIINNLI